MTVGGIGLEEGEGGVRWKGPYPQECFSPITRILSDWYFPIGDPGGFRVLSLYPTSAQRQGHSAGYISLAQSTLSGVNTWTRYCGLE